MSAHTPADLAILRRRAAQQRERAALGETKWCIAIREPDDSTTYDYVYASDEQHAMRVIEQYRPCRGWDMRVDGPADPMAAPEAFCEVVA